MTDIPESIVKRLKTCTSFPTPPAVAMQVIELAQNPDIDLASVADAISADPAIAAKVMRIANSALYARRRKSENLRQALIVLGLNATLTLALSFTLVSTLSASPAKGFDFEAYWRRALLAGTWGKLLAGEFGRRDAEEVFLASLLQDIGMIATDKFAPEVYEDIAPFQMDHLSLAEHEVSVLGANHQNIGAWLLENWQMPEYLVRAVTHSHDMSAAKVSPDDRGFVRTVALASQLADVWLSDADAAAIKRVGKDAHRHMGLLPNRLAELFEQVRAQAPAAEGIFEMDLFEIEQLQEISDTAREILTIRNLHAIQEKDSLKEHASKLEDENEELKHESSRDALTGVFNRRAFEAFLTKEFESAKSHGWPLSVIFVDLDRFKQINDTHGHQTGDDMIQEVSALLTTNVRDSDMVARYGGDEFVLLLPGSDATETEHVADRLVSQARDRSIQSESGDALSITLSLGTATTDSSAEFSSAKDLIAAADEALYHSKRSGRDRQTSYASIKAA